MRVRRMLYRFLGRLRLCWHIIRCGWDFHISHRPYRFTFVLDDGDGMLSRRILHNHDDRSVIDFVHAGNVERIVGVMWEPDEEWKGS
jgi:hypothetical protein